jgi:hypothetical protein
MRASRLAAPLAIGLECQIVGVAVNRQVCTIRVINRRDTLTDYRITAVALATIFTVAINAETRVTVVAGLTTGERQHEQRKNE